MEASEVLEKIYLFENPISGTLDDIWLSKRSDKKDIEYTRTDAFIEKACKWLQNHSMKELCMKEEDSGLVQEFINDFKKAMEE